MLFTWDTTNLCIIFRSWRITGFGSLVWSLVAVAALTAGYEAVREASRRYEARQAAMFENIPSKHLPLLIRTLVTSSSSTRSQFGTQLTPWSRELRRGAREASEGDQGCFLWCASVLLFLHHVSWLSAAAPVLDTNALQASIHDL